ncbi:signal peptidase complex subunit 2, partial [Tremellales sp. Uapishka_1]
MAPSKSPNGVALSPSLATDPLPTVKINNSSLGDIKSSLDDIVKKHLLDQSFTPSLLHPTVHLALGYSSILFAAAGVLYSLKVEFEDSKPVLWVSVIGYMILQSALWGWKRWVEGGEVFRGKRRRMVKRIETDHIQILSSTTLLPPPSPTLTLSPHSRPSSPIITPSSTLPSSPSVSSLSSSPSSEGGPSYLLHLTLSTTSNNGKSLLRKARVVSGKSVGDFIDTDGGVEEGEVGRWVGGLLSEAGLIGAEEEGAKED